MPPGPKLEPRAPIVVSTPGGQEVTCQVIPPDRPPNVTLRPGEIVFDAEGGLLRLDRELKVHRILVADELMNVRSVAVETSGTILVGTTVCGAGAIVRVDPQTGRMSVGYSNGRVGIIREGTAFATNVWEGKPSGIGVFVAVVPERTAGR